MAHVRRSAHLNVMVEAAEKAGRGLLRDFGEVENLQISKKGPGNFVSTADHKSEKLLMSLLKKARPTFGLLMEESGETKGEDATTRWIVDPLDGTSNFLHGIPHWSVSIAIEKNKEIIAGVIYDPVKDEMFWAEKGMGAMMNNKRLQVSGRKTLNDCVIGAYPTSKDQADEMMDLWKLGTQIRTLGSACLDLAYVAAGRMDAFCFERGLNAWDTAAGSLIVKEARGIVTDFEGGKDFIYGSGILAANGAIHGDLLKHLGKSSKKAKSA